MENILQTQSLTKIYSQKRAVDNVSMSVKKGDIYGFVGLNGSGKTTFIRMVTGLVKPSSGSFSLFNEPPKSKNLRRVSSMVETPAVYLNLTGFDNLTAQCKISDVSDSETPERLLKLVGLDKNNRSAVKNYSLGMKQRLGIAMALVGDPEFMLLDEPTNGLDPEGIIEIRELLTNLNKDLGITILISSHILTELSKLATTYGFIHHGKLIKETTPSEIISSCTATIYVESDNADKLTGALSHKFDCKYNGIALEVRGQNATVGEVLEIAGAAGVKIRNINKSEEDLESYFMKLIGGRHNERF